MHKKIRVGFSKVMIRVFASDGLIPTLSNETKPLFAAFAFFNRENNWAFVEGKPGSRTSFQVCSK